MNAKNELITAIALVAVFVFAIIVLQQQQQVPTAREEPTPSEQALETRCTQTTPFDLRCEGNYLVYKVCRNGEASEQRYDCSSFKTETEVGFCNPDHGGVRGKASCDLRKPAEFEQPTPVASSQATEATEFQLYKQGYCGDGACDVVEDCENCAQDCGCGANAYCKQKVCYTHSCGDGECNSTEARGGCCNDCGCSAGKQCNEYTQKCQTPFSKPLNVTAVLQNYYKDSAGNYEVIESTNSFYLEKPAKRIRLLCVAREGFGCRRIIYVSEQGIVLAEYITTTT